MSAIATLIRPYTLQSQRLDPSLYRATPAPIPTVSRDQVSAIGAPKATIVDYAGLCEVPTPDDTYRPSQDKRRRGEDILSYKAMPYAMMADGVRDAFSEALDLETSTESYGLARDGRHMFGIMTWRDPTLEEGIAVAMRSGHQMDGKAGMMAAVAQGVSFFVCANGMFPRGAQVKHPHTAKILETLPTMIAGQAAKARVRTRALIESMAALRDIPCSNYRFVAYLAILKYEGFINGTLENRALRYWKACHAGELHSAHGQQDLYSALQAVTGGLGGPRPVAPSDAFGAYGGALHVAQQIVDHGGETDVVMPPLPPMREYRAQQ